MMKELFCSISELLKATTLFNPDYCFEYVELVKTSTNTQNQYYSIRPKYYKGEKTGWVDVQNWDVGGTFYIRKTGSVSVSQSNTNKVTACTDPVLILKIPIRVVAAVPKSRFGDDAFCDDVLAQRIIAALNGNVDVAASINAIETDMNAVGYNTDSASIWSNENKGVEFNEATAQKVSYVSVDFNVQVTAYSSCLTTCENAY